jgi:hypothetical protein
MPPAASAPSTPIEDWATIRCGKPPAHIGRTRHRASVAATFPRRPRKTSTSGALIAQIRSRSDLDAEDRCSSCATSSRPHASTLAIAPRDPHRCQQRMFSCVQPSAIDADERRGLNAILIASAQQLEGNSMPGSSSAPRSQRRTPPPDRGRRPALPNDRSRAAGALDRHCYPSASTSAAPLGVPSPLARS